MLTFVGVVFTITLVALQLASAQLSPRVIRTFVRSGITKVAFGLFLATFGYAIVVIVVEGASSNPAVLRLAVTLGVVLVLASLGVFVMYVTATMRLLQESSPRWRWHLSLEACGPIGANFAPVLGLPVGMSAHRGSGRWCGTDAKGTV